MLWIRYFLDVGLLQLTPCLNLRPFLSVLKSLWLCRILQGLRSHSPRRQDLAGLQTGFIQMPVVCLILSYAHKRGKEKKKLNIFSEKNCAIGCWCPGSPHAVGAWLSWLCSAAKCELGTDVLRFQESFEQRSILFIHLSSFK